MFLPRFCTGTLDATALQHAAESDRQTVKGKNTKKKHAGMMY